MAALAATTAAMLPLRPPSADSRRRPRGFRQRAARKCFVAQAEFTLTVLPCQGCLDHCFGFGGPPPLALEAPAAGKTPKK